MVQGEGTNLLEKKRIVGPSSYYPGTGNQRGAKASRLEKSRRVTLGTKSERRAQEGKEKDHCEIKIFVITLYLDERL